VGSVHPAKTNAIITRGTMANRFMILSRYGRSYIGMPALN
jgi:hypothetical protein